MVVVVVVVVVFVLVAVVAAVVVVVVEAVPVAVAVAAAEVAVDSRNNICFRDGRHGGSSNHEHAMRIKNRTGSDSNTTLLIWPAV